MSNNDSWDEHRLLVLANFERHDEELKSLKKRANILHDKIKDQNWKMILMAVVGGIGGSGGVDLLKIIMSGLF